MTQQWWWPLGLATICAFLVAPLLIRLRPAAGPALGGSPQALGGSPQALHETPTSRLGGIAVALGYAAVMALALDRGHLKAAEVLPLGLAALPVLLVGLIEDATARVAPWQRLAAALVSAALAALYAGGRLPPLGVAELADALAWWPLALPLTCFLVAGSCNAINLIDGTHGLAGGTALLLFAGLAAAAALAGDAPLLLQSLAMAGAVAGFLCWNYPRGWLFLGDGGAYFIGFMFAELAIRLLVRHPQMSPWFIVLLAAYPTVEMSFSVLRRATLQRARLTVADALHLHSLRFHRVTLPAEAARPRADRNRANARVAPRLWLHAALCLAAALALREHGAALAACVLGYTLGYLAEYRALARRVPAPSSATPLGALRGARGLPRIGTALAREVVHVWSRFD